MKNIVFVLCLLGSCVSVMAQIQGNPYLKGAVTEQQGVVLFSQRHELPQLSKQVIYERLKTFVTEQLLKGENVLEASRITAQNPEEGTIALSMCETLWFKKSAWVSDFAQMKYQLVFQIQEGAYEVSMRRITYRYETGANAHNNSVLRAEDWITDKEALRKNGTVLTKVGGKKFRVKTIDRKNEIFQQAFTACR